MPSSSSEPRSTVHTAPDGRTELRITDPRALRALAHPARQRIVTELYAGEVLTATEAAGLVGLTPSATSYHLRALATWGVAARDEGTGDGRERPWRAVADRISVTPGAHRAAGAELSGLSMRQWIGDLDAGLTRLVGSVSRGGETGMTSRARLWLTAGEERELRERLHALVADHRGRTRRTHPEGAQPFDVYALVLPADAAAAGEAATSEPSTVRPPRRRRGG